MAEQTPTPPVEPTTTPPPPPAPDDPRAKNKRYFVEHTLVDGWRNGAIIDEQDLTEAGIKGDDVQRLINTGALRQTDAPRSVGDIVGPRQHPSTTGDVLAGEDSRRATEGIRVSGQAVAPPPHLVSRPAPEGPSGAPPAGNPPPAQPQRGGPGPRR